MAWDSVLGLFHLVCQSREGRAPIVWFIGTAPVATGIREFLKSESRVLRQAEFESGCEAMSERVRQAVKPHLRFAADESGRHAVQSKCSIGPNRFL